MGHSVCGLSSGIRVGTLWLGLIFAVLIHWHLFVMDRGQSLIIPPLFNGTNYTYWKARMRAFLQSLDEKVWQAVEIGWTKPKKAPADWDEAKIKAANFNSRALNALFSAVTNEEFKKISSTKLLRKHRPSSRQPMRVQRLSRIQSFKGPLQALKK